MRQPPPTPVSVSVINDFELIVRGVASMLEPFRSRVEVVETVTGRSGEVPVDVALLDTFVAIPESAIGARAMLDSGLARSIILYSWDVAEASRSLDDVDLVARVVSKSEPAERLVEAIEQAASRNAIGARGWASLRSTTVAGVSEALSRREQEVVALVATGRSNAEIADELGVSRESVKTFLSRAYLKIGVRNRTQAATWAMQNGLSVAYGGDDDRRDLVG